MSHEPTNGPASDYVQRAGAVYRAAIQAQVAATPRAAALRPRWRRLAPVSAGGAVLIAAGAAIAVLVSPETGKKLNAIASAQAALTSDSTVLHVVTESGFGTVGTPHQLTKTERWSRSDPRQWRVIVTAPASTDRSDERGAITGPEEVAYSSGTRSYYLRDRNTLDLTSGIKDTDSDAQLPGISGAAGLQDPVEEVRELLADGTLRREPGAPTGQIRFAGVTSIDGQPWEVRYDVQQRGYEPVRVVLARTAPSGGASAQTIETTVTFKTFERLAPTPENTSLVKMDPRADPVVRKHVEQ